MVASSSLLLHLLKEHHGHKYLWVFSIVFIALLLPVLVIVNKM